MPSGMEKEMRKIGEQDKVYWCGKCEHFHYMIEETDERIPWSIYWQHLSFSTSEIVDKVDKMTVENVAGWWASLDISQQYEIYKKMKYTYDRRST